MQKHRNFYLQKCVFMLRSAYSQQAQSETILSKWYCVRITIQVTPPLKY